MATLDKPSRGLNIGQFVQLLLLQTFVNLVASKNNQGHNYWKPNIVLILTDDLDKMLGSPDALPRTRHLIADHGADLPYWFVQTPVCCPSRAELLTGRMFHNLKTSTINGVGCMNVNVTSDVECDFYSKYYFASQFKAKRYEVGVFGKHLNNYNPTSLPPGIDRWLVNGGGDYYDPSFSWASKKGENLSNVRFDNCTGDRGQKQPCYSTSVIGNASIAWIRDHLTSEKLPLPFFAYVSVKAPHIQDGPGYPQAIPAPWYTNATVKSRAPRTPNYNASCPDHHWVVRQQPPLTDLEASKVDDLYASRLRTLLSVDDLVEEMVATLDEFGVLQDTFILFTSDNGYRFGQFRMPQGKWHPYENDIRVPFMIRGPSIRPGTIRDDIIGTHVDIMPTLLGLVDAHTFSSSHQQQSILRRGSSSEQQRLSTTVPSTMDGSDLSSQFMCHETGNSDKLNNNVTTRNAILVEIIGGDVIRYGHQEGAFNNTFRLLRIMDQTQSRGRRNLKYVEFTDCRHDWNFTQEPIEYELFDLDTDPFEMDNIISQVSQDLLAKFRHTLRRLFTCKGQTCRDVVWDDTTGNIHVAQT